MFKAKLIANPSFVFLRKHAQFIHVIIIAFNITIINLLFKEGIDKYFLILAIPAYLFAYYILYKLGRKVMNSMQERQIEFNTESIKIINKGGAIDFEISASSIESINLEKEYKYQESFLKELLNQFKGISNYHFIQVYAAGQWLTMRFMLESHYMESKLDEVIQHWVSMEIPVVYSTEPIKESKLSSEFEAIK